MQQNKTRGFFTIAQNNFNTDYVKLSYVLALSLKSSQVHFNKLSIGITPNTKIPENYKWAFDQIIEIPWGDDASKSDWKLENEWKTIHMSPYDETIKLDSDMLFFNDISTWWDIMSLDDFYICNRVLDYKGHTTKNMYYRQIFKDNKLPNVYTGFMFFKKTPKTFELFKLVEAIYVNWHVFSELCIGYKNRPSTPTTDVVFAIALKLLDLDQQFYYQQDIPAFVHMKTKLQGWNDDGIGDEWIKHINVFLNDNLECKIGNHLQYYPLHYQCKNFITDEIIKTYEYAIKSKIC